MSPAAREVLVFETEPYWAPELRRQFMGHDVRVRQCTTLADVTAIRKANRDPSRVILTSLDGREREATELLRQHSESLLMVIGSPTTAELERPFREAGVDSFINCQVSGEELARRIRRFWAAKE